jgi:hypothetical protein
LFACSEEKLPVLRLQIDGSTYEQDGVIDCGGIRKRKKAPSKRFRDEFGHPPSSTEESYPGNAGGL